MSGPYLFVIFLAWQAVLGPWWYVLVCWAGLEIMLWVWRRDLDYQAGRK